MGAGAAGSHTTCPHAWSLPRLLVPPLPRQDSLDLDGSSLCLTSMLPAVAKVALFVPLLRKKCDWGCSPAPLAL